MTRRTQSRNQYESTTVGELAIGAFTVSVESTAGLNPSEPMYLVIEPDVPGQREWLRVISFTGNQINIDPNPNDYAVTGRNMPGSDGDLLHPQGAKVRSVPTSMIYDDLFSDTEENADDLTQHINASKVSDPHANAAYLQSATINAGDDKDADKLYLLLSGSNTTAIAPMSGHFFLFANPTEGKHPSTMEYTDTADAAERSYADNSFLRLDGPVADYSMKGFNLTEVDTLVSQVAGDMTLRRATGFEMLIEDPDGTDRLVFQDDGSIVFNWPDGSPALKYDPAGFLGIWDFFVGEVNINGVLSKVDDPFGPLDAANKQWVEANFVAQ